MSAVVRHNYAGIYVLQQAGVCELYQNKVLLARTDNTAIVDKLFFKLALEIASTRVGAGARAQLTAEGRRAFGCEGRDTSSVTADAVPPSPQGEGSREEKPKRKVFKKPTVEEIANYCRERGDTLTDPQEFYDYYESVGWMVAGAEMNNWREMVSLWFIREWDKKRERSEAG